jgi:hypothetical protein
MQFNLDLLVECEKLILLKNPDPVVTGLADADRCLDLIKFK